TRDALSSPNFMVTTSPGLKLKLDASPPAGGGPSTYPLYRAICQRIYEIYPKWDGNLTAILNQNFVPMGGRAYIYYSDNAKGMVLKVEKDALADAPWLMDFYSQTPDGKTPAH